MPKLLSKDGSLKQLLKETQNDPDAVPHGVQLQLLDFFRFLNLSDLLAGTDTSDSRPLPDLIGTVLNKLERDMRDLVKAKSLADVLEEATLGVTQFQTNPLLAASAGTFAGSVARKAAQHVFLKEIE